MIQLVWLAQTAQLIDPELYTDGAKTALQDQIDHAKAVLSGTYELPFVRNRAFYAPRPDEEIQAAIEYCSMAPSYKMTTYGLKPALEWYSYQNIVTALSKSVIIAPSFDTYVKETEPEVSFSSRSTVEIDQGHTAYIGFELSKTSVPVCKARMFLTNHHIDSKKLFLHEVDSADWWHSHDGFDRTFSQVQKDEEGQPDTGRLLTAFYVGFKDRPGYVDLTPYVLERAKQGENRIALAMTNEPGAVACGFYSSEYPEPDKRPMLELLLQEFDEGKLAQRYSFVLEQAIGLADSAVIGEALFCYPEPVIDALNEEIAAAKQARTANDNMLTAKAIVRLHNAVRRARHEQVYRTDIEPDTNLFFSSHAMEELRRKIVRSPALQDIFDKLKELSDQLSLEEIQALETLLQDQPDMERINSNFKLWSKSPELIFTPPMETVTASLMFVLPSSENEAEGLGHVWIDDVKISPSDASDLPLHNAGFEEGLAAPNYWRPAVLKGEPVIGYEDRPPYVNNGKRSVYLANPTAQDEGAWLYEKEIPMTGGTAYTLNYHAKIDGKFRSGVYALLTFKDESGKVVGSYKGIHNKKSMLGNDSMKASLFFQADAIVYSVTGSRMYAEKAKTRMLWMLNDFCQGVESWLITCLRPDGNDQYGAVQGGRIASVLATSYSLIKDAGVFTPEEYSTLLARVDYLLRDLIDLRDRTELGEFKAQQHTSNWHTDMCAGAALLGLAFPELPHARQWFDNGRTILKGQLDYHLNDDGSWPETIRYLYEVIMRSALFAKALRHVTGENWFHGTKLARSLAFSCPCKRRLMCILMAKSVPRTSATIFSAMVMSLRRLAFIRTKLRTNHLNWQHR